MLREVLPAFVNELASAQAPLVLVLDDYHLVTSAQVHATVATLLDRCPPQLHLMLITRADPPLPRSRLRVRRDLAELRADDLRFSAAEAVEFFGSRLERCCPSRTCSGCWRGPRDGPRGCSWPPCGCPVLHRRAAQWYADHGDTAEAIGHAIASGDETLSGRLVAAHWRQPFNAGQLETVRM